MKPEMRFYLKKYRHSENLKIPNVHLQGNQDFGTDNPLSVGAKLGTA
jgi:hypothetical protein